MIQSILIANRGEIAIRIAQTAKRMGITTYAIRTAKEPEALYLSAADHVINFPNTDSTIPEFLDIESIVAIAKANGIEAIHPGYGYLSENALLADHCQQTGVIFIGPPANVIRAMGDKITAKEIAGKAGIPMPGGSNGAVSNVEAATQAAQKIGFPVIIKASAGGGGRGMRIVHKAKELPRLFNEASSEALRAFNDPSVFVEKYLVSPKHIEMQVVADAHGNIIHLGERECSVQRKHQKLIEEAPSPALTPALRAQMAEAAVNLAKAVNYQSLGTVEFLLDKDNKFYFMEMNTRIQVEHPVTEMITGVDLVELQIRIASGEKLPICQADVKQNGWAIECRINAEDVQSGFAPATGTIKGIRFPQGNHIRFDTGIARGSEVTPHFDSMMAKLIVHKASRKDAIKATMTALQQLHIKGVKTTIPFCKAVMDNKLFKSGNYNTSLIEEQMTDLVYREEDEEILATLLAISHYTREHEQVSSEMGSIDPWVLKKRLKSL
ncbi:acetyl-CoA carboxylase biotin carboxylase subunit [Breznakibacter xylanolyticus]|uniref:Acetyl-CoA carboxylase biotin carboxylase subunit n=1 Tax=Breznakibacter xylanolyticus TaxID=990 RepID=A0A2W7P740_9BACT|nr:biotin carboxylase N-terminal domain-containing protein [Breznakibacter xylanolyticus]PZX19212.1 acetyl-CoA carboxylase biotin carboxylase subunit [Breznakibacter xylanolyticus]